MSADQKRLIEEEEERKNFEEDRFVRMVKTIKRIYVDFT